MQRAQRDAEFTEFYGARVRALRRVAYLVVHDRVLTAASEYVEAPAPETADWQVPVEVLHGIATDPDLLDPAGVAHEPLG